MTASCKSVQISESNVCDLNAIYSRVITLLDSDRDFDVNVVFTHMSLPRPHFYVHEGWNADL
jgi:hypothetical protein